MRKTISTILLVSLWTQIIFAAGVPQKFPTDTLQIGKGSSAANKDLIFDTNLGASNPKVRANPSNGKIELNKPLGVTGAIDATGAISTTSGDISTASGNLSATGTGSIGGNLTLGTGAAADKSITVNRGGSNPFLKWSETALSWIFSNDGTLEKKLGTGGGGASTGVNVLTNDSFEDFVSGSLLGWSNVGGTLTQETYTSGAENDTKYFQFVATGAGQYFESALITVPTNFNGGGCQVDFKKLNIATNDLFKVEALDSSSNVLATGNVKVSSWSKFPTLSFACPSAGATFRIRVTSLAAGTLQGDKAYLGSNQNLVGVNAQEQTAEFSATTGFGSTGTTSRKFTNLSKSAGQGLFTTNFSTTMATDGLAVTMLKNAILDGEYCDQGIGSGGPIIGVTVNFGGATNVNSDYASGVRSKMTIGNGDYACVPFTISVATGDVVRFQVSSVGQFIASQLVANVKIKATSPVDSIAVNTEQSSWFIDANIGGANFPVTVAASTYTQIENGSLDLVLNTAKGSASAEIACTSGTASSGLNCGASNESLGIAFIPGAGAGVYEVCTELTMDIVTGGEAVFQLVETQNATATIIQEGGSRKGVYGASGNRAPYMTCGTFNFSDTSKKTIRLMYEKPNTNAVNMYIDRSGTDGQRDMHWIVRPLLSAYNRPILTGDQVTAKGGNKTILFGAATIKSAACTSTPCTLESKIGSNVTNITRSAAGTYFLNYSATVNPPICTVTITPFTSQTNRCQIIGGASTTQTAISCFTSGTSTGVDESFNVNCIATEP